MLYERAGPRPASTQAKQRHGWAQTPSDIGSPTLLMTRIKMKDSWAVENSPSGTLIIINRSVAIFAMTTSPSIPKKSLEPRTRSLLRRRFVQLQRQELPGKVLIGRLSSAEETGKQKKKRKEKDKIKKSKKIRAKIEVGNSKKDRKKARFAEISRNPCY